MRRFYARLKKVSGGGRYGDQAEGMNVDLTNQRPSCIAHKELEEKTFNDITCHIDI
jgi:hypothetical protein